MPRAKREKITPAVRSKECQFCKADIVPSWQEYEVLKNYLSSRGRILSSQYTGVCVKHQRKLARAIKQARHLALVPFTTQE
ncbi:MAG: 30S ribosomal protein S18 [Patescibacteria group bacterium]|jgi:small subunit ribosomal protein S18